MGAALAGQAEGEGCMGTSTPAGNSGLQVTLGKKILIPEDSTEFQCGHKTAGPLFGCQDSFLALSSPGTGFVRAHDHRSLWNFSQAFDFTSVHFINTFSTLL